MVFSDFIRMRSPNKAAVHGFFESVAEGVAKGKSGPAYMCAASSLNSAFRTSTSGTADFGVTLDDEDGGSLAADFGTHGSSFFASGEVENGYRQKTEVSLPLPREADLNTLQKTQQDHNAMPITTDNILPFSQMAYTELTVNAAVDISPALLTSFLSYTEELIKTAGTKSSTLREEEEERCHVVSGTMDFVKVRLFPLENCFLFYTGKDLLHQPNTSSVVLSWFLQRHHELAATMMSMGFSFLLALEEHRFSWKKAAEVPLTALQLLSNYAHTVTFRDGVNEFETLSARQHLFLMAACLLVCWKYADIDATAVVLLQILDSTFFHHHRVLNVRDIIQVESVVLRVCGFCIEEPRWWAVAIQLLSESLAEEEEQMMLGDEEGWERQKDVQVGWPLSFNENEPRCRYETSLEQLLLACERVLLFLMDAAAGDGESTAEQDGCAGGAGQSFQTRGVVRSWMESHPLFGVALAVCCGAVNLDWAASHIGPTGNTHHKMTNNNTGGVFEQRHVVFACGIRSVIRDADEAAQRELYRMVTLLKEVLHQFF
ncbi:hypothetical protein C3747_51g192 [Trypanosoma cruzi]|uniref:Uncharacterized protein n=2 Tax=Trypanosoma cruzi TaxID=5693 RepID=A0A2V2WUY1_TRYCR|nr:hypothetical protein C3747_51g192 [Trypanosoma cruzi]